MYTWRDALIVNELLVKIFSMNKNKTFKTRL